MVTLAWPAKKLTDPPPRASEQAVRTQDVAAMPAATVLRSGGEVAQPAPASVQLTGATSRPANVVSTASVTTTSAAPSSAATGPAATGPAAPSSTSTPASSPAAPTAPASASPTPAATVATNGLSATATASVVANPAPSIASVPLTLKAADTTKRASDVVQQAVATKASPLGVAIAAADASAVVRPSSVVSIATSPAPAAPEMTADGRIVTSKRTTVTYEPLHAVPIPSAGLRAAPPSIADSIVVYKRERTLTLFYRGVPQRSYFVALGSKPVGDKLQAGDKRTPEGLFYINAHNPASKYHLALRISYPDAAHRARSESLGFDPGGDIMIHGLPKDYSDAGKDHRLNDWTNGCVALTNQEIEEIWRAVPDGTPVQIKP